MPSFPGTPGNDTLVGTDDADDFTGLAGDDTITGLGGDDTIDGGADNDTAVYSEKTLAVVVALNGAVDAAVTVGGVAEDTVRNVENVVGGTAGDTLTGDAFANAFRGEGGADTLDGGSGLDTADYSDKTDSIVVTLNGATDATVTVGGAAEDTIRNIENIIGGSGNDTFVGDTFQNVFDGGGGTDTIDYSGRTQGISVVLDGATAKNVNVGGFAEDSVRNIENVTGGLGSDSITGDGQVNILNGGSNDDTLQGGGAADILDGGAGTDTVSFSDKTQPVVVVLTGAADFVVTVGGIAEDTIRNFENAIGGSGDDTLTGDGQDNSLSGGGGGSDTLTGGGGDDFLSGGGVDTAQGNDVLDGGEGDDVLSGGNGSDLLKGGAGEDILTGGLGIGSDTADYSDKTASVVVDILLGETRTVVVGGVAEDSISQIENLIGGSGNDSLTGDSAANEFTGNSGNDTLNGDRGNDVLKGGDGTDTLNGGDHNDILRGGDGIDALDGGGGSDVADFSNETASVVALLNGPIVSTAIIGGVAEDTFVNMEGLIGGSGADTLTGDTLANVITGGGGADDLDGGEGIDTVDYGDRAAAVVVTLNGATPQSVIVGGFAEDTIRNFENATGGSGNDILAGDGLANILSGGDGGDRLDGMGGADTMIGGAGNDTYVIGAGDTIVESSGQGADTVQSASTFTLANHFENLILTGTAAANGTGNTDRNLITGNSAANALNGLSAIDTLLGYGGNDALDGGNGADSMTGGNGDDTYVVDDAGDTVVEDSNSGSGVDRVQSSVSHTLSANVENLTLTGFAPIAGAGNALDNEILGNSNANMLFGSGGDDTLNGGGNADAMSGGTGDDTYVVDNAGDTATENAGSGADTVRSSVTFTLSANIETLVLNGAAAINGVGNAGANTLYGNSAANRLDGNAGNDTLTGFGGADRFVFDDGDGADTVADFQNGSDKFDLTAVTGVDEFSDLAVTDNGATVTVDYGTGAFTLANVGNPAVIDASDFVFA